MPRLGRCAFVVVLVNGRHTAVTFERTPCCTSFGEGRLSAITVSTIFALLGGVLLGLRFNAFILTPVIPVAWIGAIATCRVCDGDVWTAPSLLRLLRKLAF